MKYILAAVFILFSGTSFAIEWGYFGHHETSDRFVVIVEKLEKSNDAATRKILETNLYVEAKLMENFYKIQLEYWNGRLEIAQAEKNHSYISTATDMIARAHEIIEQLHETFAKVTGRELE